jgi:thiamine monophosphate synthase
MGWKGSISRSCHSFEEIKEWKDRCNYLSLSPIYDSISKQGYLSAFSREQIEKAVAEGIIDNKVLALGGVTFDKVEEVERLGFGGAMVLGDAWR